MSVRVKQEKVMEGANRSEQDICIGHGLPLATQFTRQGGPDKRAGHELQCRPASSSSDNPSFDMVKSCPLWYPFSIGMSSLSFCLAFLIG